jgi:hypothetical protein
MIQIRGNSDFIQKFSLKLVFRVHMSEIKNISFLVLSSKLFVNPS